jgi:hypothetical protein
VCGTTAGTRPIVAKFASDLVHPGAAGSGSA